MHAVLVCLLALASTGVARAQPGGTDINDPGFVGSRVILLLENQDTLSGTVIEVRGNDIILQHPVLEQVAIPTTRVLEIRRPQAPQRPRAETPLPVAPPVPVEPPSAPNENIPEVVTEAPARVERIPDPQPEQRSDARWSSLLRFGVNGSEGNSERLNAQLEFDTTRQSSRGTFNLNANYILNTTDGERTRNRLFLNARNEWRAQKGRLDAFLQGGAEFDEFRDFDVRASTGGGISYRWIDNDKTRLNTRLGAGASREFGGPNEDVIPEAILALVVRHKIDERQSVFGSAELFPDLNDLGEFRSVLEGRYDIKITEDLTLNFRLQHRFDSDTQRAENADLDYSITLTYGF